MKTLQIFEYVSNIGSYYLRSYAGLSVKEIQQWELQLNYLHPELKLPTGYPLYFPAHGGSRMSCIIDINDVFGLSDDLYEHFTAHPENLFTKKIINIDISTAILE